MSSPAFISILRAFCLAFVLCWPVIELFGQEQVESGDALFSKVRSIFAAKCIVCHGGKDSKADLDLSSSVGIVRGGESGKVVIAGEPDESLLFEKIRDGEMPPEGKNPLTEAEIETLRAWIATGAKTELAASKLTPHDVMPIIRLRCASCHGRTIRQGELDLRTVESLLRGGKSGPVIVPGKPDESLALQRIEKGEMPPKRDLAKFSVKPMEQHEFEIIAKWIEQGIPQSDQAEEAELAAAEHLDPQVSDEDRSFWAFQAPRRINPPDIRDPRIRNPIDAFVLEKLQSENLSLSASASPEVLIRRAYVDLLGLLPTPEQVDSFVTASRNNPAAYEQLIDRLLASPRYGERRGEYWLDLAGYSDSEGLQNSDLVRPFTYRYRDYVIRSFNNDKPYDRFLLEQIAGDELADYEHAEVITEEIYDNLVATGFLRMTSDGTFSGITGFVPDRLEVVDDVIEVLSSSVMGLTMRCARCHSHKFDPIPQADYYRLAAVFKGALDEHDWLKPTRQGDDPGKQDRYLPYVTTAEKEAWHELNRQIDEEIAALKAAGEAEDKIKAADAKRQPQPLIRALWDRGEPTPTYLLRRGNYLTPSSVVRPEAPSVLQPAGTAGLQIGPPWEGSTKTGRRLAFARWLTAADHPLTARVMVNRVWHHHFGRGIVATLDDFGRAGAKPTHPELLDWLARRFVEDGWSVKSLHCLIMTSATYRQSSQVTAAHELHDPDNQLFSRMMLRRMDAEVVNDSLIQMANKLKETPFGPPDGISARGDGLVSAVETAGGWRRSIYVMKRRTEPLTILTDFDRPRMNPNCVMRSESIVAIQSLHLLNNQMVHQLAEAFADRVIAETGATNEAEQGGIAAEHWIRRVFQIALSRVPSDEELNLLLPQMTEFEAAWRTQLKASGRDLTAEQIAQEARRKSLVNACHAIMNSAAFLYLD